jgi:hypothetical protein
MEHDGRAMRNADNDAPMVVARTPDGLDASTGSRKVDSRVEQVVLKTAADEPLIQPKSEGRVTLKFTDDGGVEGRLRVALRGQSVRATIVSADPATVERIGAGVPELQRVLDRQGFRDPQITVQQSRPVDESASVVFSSSARPGADSAGGLQNSRTIEDQANRERQQPSTRDNQHQHNGRSNQRSKERQER